MELLPTLSNTCNHFWSIVWAATIAENLYLKYRTLAAVDSLLSFDIGKGWICLLSRHLRNAVSLHFWLTEKDSIRLVRVDQLCKQSLCVFTQGGVRAKIWSSSVSGRATEEKLSEKSSNLSWFSDLWLRDDSSRVVPSTDELLLCLSHGELTCPCDGEKPQCDKHCT